MSTTGSIEDKPRPSSTGRGMSGAAMSALRKARSLAAVSAGFGSPSRSKSSSAAFTVPDDNKSDNSDPPTHLAATSPTPIGPSSAATQHLLSSASSRSSGSSASSVSTTPSTAPTMVRSATLSANSRAAASAASAANVPSITTAPSSSSSIPQRAQVPSRSRATSASSSGSTADASSTTSAPPHTSGPLVPTPPKSPQRTPPAFSPTATSFTTEVDSSAGIFGLAAALQSESNDSFYAPGSSSNKLTKRPVTAARSLRESDTTPTSSVTNSSTTTGSIITSHGPLNPNSLVGKIAAKNAAAKAAAANGTTTPITKDKKKSIETGSVNKKESPGSKSIPDEEKISSTTSTTIPTPSTFYRVIRILAIITCIILIILSPIFYLIYTRFGFGKDFPIPSYLDDDVKGVLSTPTPESFLEIVGSLPLPPGNIAVSSRYRVFFTFHPEYNPPINVAELTSKTTFKAYPPPPIAPPAKSSGIAATTPPPALPHPPLQSVLSLRIDKQDRLWLLDFAHHGLRADTLPPQLVCYKLGKWKDEFVMNYSFPSNIAGFGSMLNDFQVDPTGEYLYIVDTSIISMNPSIIVFSVKSKRSWRLLENHSSMFGSSYFVNVRGTPGYHVGFGPLGLKVNIDSVALDRSGSTLYYGAVTSDRLYSIATSQVLHLVERMERENGSRPEDLEALGYQVRLVSSDKPMTDGLSTDGNGNIWMTSIEHSAIVLATPMTIHAQSPSGPSFGISSSTGVGGGAGVLTDMQAMVYTKVIESKSLLRWPDGLSFGPDGLYITNSALHLKYSNFQGNITQYAPFHILKIVTKHLKNKLLYKKKGFSLPSPGQ